MSYHPCQLSRQKFHRRYYSRKCSARIQFDAKKASSRKARRLGKAMLDDAPVRVTKGWP